MAFGAKLPVAHTWWFYRGGGQSLPSGQLERNTPPAHQRRALKLGDAPTGMTINPRLRVHGVEWRRAPPSKLRMFINFAGDWRLCGWPSNDHAQRK